jgi:Flp pilus assembly protein TadG
MPIAAIAGRLAVLARRFGADSRGATVVVTALMLPVLVGGIGLGVEVSYWLQTKRSLQNAADAAAVAAATNGSGTYAKEANAVTARYGFVNGANNVTVAASNAVTCPSGAGGCYKVTINATAPLFFTQILGYAGTVSANGNNLTGIAASAVAKRTLVPREYCILALGAGATTAFRTNGAPKADLSHCNVMSNTNATCNGSNLYAPHVDAGGTNNGCGVIPSSNMPVVTDPYSGLASNIPADSCGGSYPQAPTKKNDPDLPLSNQWSGSYTFSGNKIVCGDLKLTSDVTITGGNVTLVVFNGSIDLNGYTLKSGADTGLTIVFAGDSNPNYDHIPTGGGMLDIAAPKSGPWKGIALYQAPNLLKGVDLADAGNSPAWKMTGLVYLPHSSVTFSGAVNKASNGLSCFGMVVDNILINGTAMIYDFSQCNEAGLTLPSNQVAGRGELVY